MNKDQVKGRVKEATGTLKETTGKAVGNKHLAEKGSIEKDVGKAQAGLGDIKNDLKK